MFGSPTAPIRTALEALARSLDRAALSGDEAVAVVHDLGVIRKLADALAGQVALQVEQTGAHRRYCDRTAAVTVAKAFGIEAGEAQRIVETARKVCGSAATEASVRTGLLSVREAELVADAVSAAPGSERRMLSAARQGLRCLKDEAARVRAEAEDPAARAARQRRDRSLSWWTDPDGMVNGRLRLPAEIGGPIMGWFDEATRRTFRDRSRADAAQHESHAAYAADVFVELVRRNAWPTAEPADTDDGLEAGSGALVGLEPDATGAASGPVDLGFSHTVHIVIDHAALVRGECVEGERCEIPGVGPVSVTWARELLGDAFVTAVVKKGVDITTVAHLEAPPV